MRTCLSLFILISFLPLLVQAEGVSSDVHAPEPAFIFPDPHYSFTTAITVPQPLALGGQVTWPSLPKTEGYFETGYFRYPFSSTASRAVSVMSLVVGGRYRPFSNWFYLGGNLGYRRLQVTADISALKSDGVSLASSAKLTLNSLITGLFVGGSFEVSRVLTLGFDLGVQISLLHGGSTEIVPDPNNTDSSTDLSVDGERALNRLSGLPLPQIALIRLIWKI